MKTIAATRAQREIEHGRWIAAHDPESTWGWSTPAGRLRAERRARLIGDGAHLRRGKAAVEIGCGTGMFTEMFAATGASIVAVDISEELLTIARARDLPPDRIRFVRSRIEEMNGAGEYDAVVGSSVLHHLDVEPALTSIYRLLKPGGVLSVAEPNMLNPQVFLERHPFWLKRLFPYVSPDETAFVRWRLAWVLRSAGFVSIRIAPFDWLHPSTPEVLIPIVWRAGSVFESIPAVREFAGSLYIRAERPAA
jgi:2-polyprenyl-3-methyl-5-hydroxy-6-metoxy-1,4-benzoquinol methylase